MKALIFKFIIFLILFYWFTLSLRSQTFDFNTGTTQNWTLNQIYEKPIQNKIIDTSSITISSPNGNEQWPVDSEQEISWTNTGIIDSVRIKYSTDSATSYKTIDSFPNTHSFIWKVPDEISSSCIILIEDASDGTPYDISDIVFSIVPKPTGSVYFVTNTNDNGPGSLRNALTAAAGDTTSDTVYFSIPETDTSFNSNIGIWTIKPSTNLIVPQGTIVDGRIPVTKDSSRPGIEVNGTLAIPAGITGITMSENTQIYGLTVNHCKYYGVRISEPNVIIAECYIGTDPSGNTAEPNGFDGIFLDENARNVLICYNLISGNDQNGIHLAGVNTNGNMILNNFIGTDYTGTSSLPNGYNGIYMQSGTQNNIIEQNLASGNLRSGIHLIDSATSFNVLRNNIIGTDINGSSPLPNGDFGIALFNGPQDNVIGPDNFVSQNTLDGILIDGSNNFKSTVRNTITANKVTANGRRGIYNFRGGNAELSPPVINSFAVNAVSGTAGPGQRIEFFADENDEGAVFIGAETADISGNFLFQLPIQLSPTQNLTATATDSAGNTSEFCQPFKITSIYEMSDQVNPKEFRLYQNYPNPFNPVTRINYSIPKADFVTIKIYDILGKEAATLVNEEKSAGSYSIKFDGSNFSSGIYFYRMKAGSFMITKKLVLIE